MEQPEIALILLEQEHVSFFITVKGVESIFNYSFSMILLPACSTLLQKVVMENIQR